MHEGQSQRRGEGGGGGRTRTRQRGRERGGQSCEEPGFHHSRPEEGRPELPQLLRAVLACKPRGRTRDAPGWTCWIRVGLAESLPRSPAHRRPSALVPPPATRKGGLLVRVAPDGKRHPCRPRRAAAAAPGQVCRWPPLRAAVVSTPRRRRVIVAAHRRRHPVSLAAPPQMPPPRDSVPHCRRRRSVPGRAESPRPGDSDGRGRGELGRARALGLQTRRRSAAAPPRHVPGWARLTSASRLATGRRIRRPTRRRGGRKEVLKWD
jgi:hypothetical protein